MCKGGAQGLRPFCSPQPNSSPRRGEAVPSLPWHIRGTSPFLPHRRVRVLQNPHMELGLRLPSGGGARRARSGGRRGSLAQERAKAHPAYLAAHIGGGRIRTHHSQGPSLLSVVGAATGDEDFTCPALPMATPPAILWPRPLPPSPCSFA